MIFKKLTSKKNAPGNAPRDH